MNQGLGLHYPGPVIPTAKHVFISYVREDNAAVDRLCKHLAAAHIPVWRDRKDLGPGDDWKRKIRDAIESGTVAFVPCFSENQRTKDSSYMNTEMHVAIDEFSKRRPGEKWMIPVRFDDGADPDDWALGGGQSLRDYNYVDLFGENYSENMVGLVMTINSILGGPTPSAATVQASVEEASAADRPAMMRDLTKKLLLDPTKRIDVSDLISGELRRLLVDLRSADRFPLDIQAGASYPPGGRDVWIADLASRYWQASEPLCWSLQVAARYASSPDQLTPWTQALVALHTYATEYGSGRSVLRDLRAIPLLACVVAAAAASVGDDRWENFRTLLVDCTVTTGYNTASESIAETVNFHDPFNDAGDYAPTLLALGARGTHTHQSAYEAVKGGGQRVLLKPIADWMHAALQPLFSEQFVDDYSYAAAFDRAEVMLGAITQDSANQHATAVSDSSRAWLMRSRWFGRSTYRYQRGDASPVIAYIQQLAEQGEHWAPIRSGLFGGQTARAQKALTAYSDDFDNARRNGF